MIYLSAELSVHRSPELVWGVLADSSAYATWVMGLVAVEHDGGPPFGLGSQFSVTWKLGPRRVHASTEITEYTATRSLSTETRVGADLVLLDRLVLERGAQPGVTRLVATSELVERAGVFRLFSRSTGLLGSPHARRPEQAIYDRCFRELSLLIEARTAAPYR